MTLEAHIQMRYPSGVTIEGEFSSPTDGFLVTGLLGPSGCGKTTLLRCLAGLERPAHGRIEFDGQTWFDSGKSVHRSPQDRDIGFLFQDFALFPHLTVEANIAYGLRRLPSRERTSRVLELLDRFQIAELKSRHPRHISGGQQQRVALARSLARGPRLLLLDEPLSSLDASLRDQMRVQLRRLLAIARVPVFLVTHDRAEASALCDRLVVMESGRILQSGPAHEVFMRPVNQNVARIVGIETVAEGEIVSVADGFAHVRIGGASLVALAPAEPMRAVHVCIKGEDVVLQKGTAPHSSARNQLPGVVEWLSPEGPLVRIGIDCGFELAALVTRPSVESLELVEGSAVTVLIKAPSIHLMPRLG